MVYGPTNSGKTYTMLGEEVHNQDNKTSATPKKKN